MAGEHVNETAKARVVVIDDHMILAGALRAVLNGSPDLQVVATAATIADGMDAVHRAQPDIVVSDYRLPDGDIVDHIEAVLASAPGCRLLVFTGWPDEAGLIRAIQAGALGFLDKRQNLDDLVHGIRRVLADELVVAPRLLPVLARRIGGAKQKGETLSGRELEVLTFLADGATTREIASALHLSVNTVRNHVTRLLAKLGARSRLEAVRIGVERGLIRFDPEPG